MTIYSKYDHWRASNGWSLSFPVDDANREIYNYIGMDSDGRNVGIFGVSSPLGSLELYNYGPGIITVTVANENSGCTVTRKVDNARAGEAAITRDIYNNYAQSCFTTYDNCVRPYYACQTVACNYLNCVYPVIKEWEGLASYGALRSDGIVYNYCKWSCIYDRLIWNVNNPSIRTVTSPNGILYATYNTGQISNYNPATGTWSNMLNNKGS